MTHEACYWIIGRDNTRQAPAVAVDLHKHNGDLSAETWTRDLGPGDDARAVALAYAAANGVPAERVTFDDASTDFFATC